MVGFMIMSMMSSSKNIDKNLLQNTIDAIVLQVRFGYHGYSDILVNMVTQISWLPRLLRCLGYHCTVTNISYFRSVQTTVQCP